MIFIGFLIAAATVLAVTAAFFSVYGLAHLFTGIFWMVVVMGSSLELGKLIAVSYLYRFWDKTNVWLKGYLMLGVAVLMLLTSIGIFGILSGGYQADAIPMKQVSQQIDLLEQEKASKQFRKRQIDDQIAQLPTDMVKGREKLVKQFKDEQIQVTARLNDLDKQIQELRNKLILTESHVGPITYIAKAFGLEPDNATSYLIVLIVLGFDPMAVALTLATNIALRERDEQKKLEEERLAKEEELKAAFEPEPQIIHLRDEVVEERATNHAETSIPIIEPEIEPELSEPNTEPELENKPIADTNMEPANDLTAEPIVGDEPKPIEKVEEIPLETPIISPQDSSIRWSHRADGEPVYSHPWELINVNGELFELHEYYKNTLISKTELTDEEIQLKDTIEKLMTQFKM